MLKIIVIIYWFLDLIVRILSKYNSRVRQLVHKSLVNQAIDVHFGRVYIIIPILVLLFVILIC